MSKKLLVLSIELIAGSTRPFTKVTYGEERILFQALGLSSSSAKSQPVKSANPDHDLTGSRRLLLYTELNDWLATLSEQKLDSIFEIYKYLSDSCEPTHDLNDKLVSIKEAVSAMCQVVTHHDTRTWVAGYLRHYYDIRNFAAEFVPQEGYRHTPEQTFLQRDYIELLSFSLYMRLLAPFTGTAMSFMKDSAGSQASTAVLESVLAGYGEMLEHPAINKLRGLIGKMYRPDITDPLAINQLMVNGVSTEQQPEIILADTIIKVVCAHPMLHGNDPSITNLVTGVYSYASGRMNGNRDSASGVRVKANTGSINSSDEGGDSIPGGRREQVHASETSVAAGLVSIHYPYIMADRLSKGRVGEELFKNMLNRVNTTYDPAARNPAAMPIITTLMYKLGVNHIVVHRSLEMHDALYFRKMVAICQSVLWVTGHKYLSLLVSSESHTDEDGSGMLVITAGSRMSPLSKLNREKVDVLWPNMPLQGSKSNPVHPVVADIEYVAAKLSESTIMSKADPDLLSDYFGTKVPEGGTVLSYPPAVRDVLFSFYECVAKGMYDTVHELARRYGYV